MRNEAEIIEEIENMTRESICFVYRFAESGHIFFNSSLPYNKIFMKRFKELGGFSPEISKKIGW